MICDKCKEDTGRATEVDGKFYCKWCVDEVIKPVGTIRRVPGCDNNPPYKN